MKHIFNKVPFSKRKTYFFTRKHMNISNKFCFSFNLNKKEEKNSHNAVIVGLCAKSYNLGKVKERRTTMAPKYQELLNQLELEMRQMRLLGVTKLPTESQLSKKFSCSRQTVRTALGILESEGKIVKRHGSGSYLSDPGSPMQTLVLFLTEDEDAYIYPDLLNQIRPYLQKTNYSLSPRSTGGLVGKEREILLSALSDTPAAVIIDPIHDVIPNPNIILIEELKKKGIPVVFFRAAYPAVSNPIVIGEENKEGGAMLVRYLKDRGHYQICGLFRSDDSCGLSRYQGCMKALLENDLPYDERSFLLFSYLEQKKLMQGDRSVLLKFIRLYLPRHTAVICQNDLIAYHLIRLLSEEGKNIPSDIAVVSFDNSYYATSGNIRITSLGHEEKAVSHALCEAVTASLLNRPARSVSLPWKLHARASG